MKEQAKRQLIQDLRLCVIIAVVTFVIFLIGIIGNINGLREDAFSEGVFTGIVGLILAPLLLGVSISGWVMGVRWLAPRFPDWGFIKWMIIFFIAGPIGCILVFPITIIRDIIAYSKA